MIEILSKEKAYVLYLQKLELLKKEGDLIICNPIYDIFYHTCVEPWYKKSPGIEISICSWERYKLSRSLSASALSSLKITTSLNNYEPTAKLIRHRNTFVIPYGILSSDDQFVQAMKSI